MDKEEYKTQEERFQAYYDLVESKRVNEGKTYLSYDKEDQIELRTLLANLTPTEVQAWFSPLRLVNEKPQLQAACGKAASKIATAREQYKKWYAENYPSKKEPWYSQGKSASVHGTTSKTR